MRVTVCHNLDRRGDGYTLGDSLAAVFACTMPRTVTDLWALGMADELLWAFRETRPDRLAAYRLDTQRAAATYQAARLRLPVRGDVLILDDRWAFTWCAYGLAIQLDLPDLNITVPLPAPPAGALPGPLRRAAAPALPATPAPVL